MTFISTIEPGLMIIAFSMGSKSLVSLAPERTLSKGGWLVLDSVDQEN